MQQGIAAASTAYLHLFKASHGDPGPFNTIFENGMPAAFIDWDGARPGAWMTDLAYLAWTWCIQSSGNVPVVDQARHLRAVRDGYGRGDAQTLVESIIRSQRQTGDTAARLATRPAKSDHYYLHQQQAIEWATSDRQLTEQNFELFVTALG